MKKLNYILLAGMALLATACVSDEEDLFDKSAAVRMNELVESNTKLLESSEEGWVFNYFIGQDAVSGGIAQTVRFSDGKAYIRSEYADDVTKEYASLYQVKGEQECLLSFDTYNAVFHYWSEPQGSNNTTGYEGDYEFTFKNISANQDTITLKGKKYGVYAQLIRLKEAGSGAEYVSKAAHITSRIYEYPRTLAIVNGEEMEIKLDEGVLTYSTTVSAPTELDPDATEVSYFTNSCITTDKGIHFYTPVTFGTETFQDCIYDEEQNTLIAEGANVELPFTLPKGYMTYEEVVGDYYTFDNTGQTINMSIKADEEGTGYIISGMTRTGYNVIASYNEKTGSINIPAQYLGTYGSYEIYLRIYGKSGGATSSSFYLIGSNSVSDDGVLTISFLQNNTSYTLTTFMEYAYYASNGNGAGYFRWFVDPLRFIKK